MEAKPQEKHLAPQNAEDWPALWEKFARHFAIVEAAGGVVSNAQGEVLLIYRRGFWDLPKGKMEEGETPPETALREVEEECGLKYLSITGELGVTYHTYRQGNQPILKRTYWFFMSYAGTEKGSPQIEEDIDELRWLRKSELSAYADKSYGNIAELLQKV